MILINLNYINEGETAPGEVRHRRIDSVHFITSRHVPSPTLAWLLTDYLQAPDCLLYMRGHLHKVMHLIATLPAQSVLVYTRWCDRHCRVTGACPSIPIIFDLIRSGKRCPRAAGPSSYECLIGLLPSVFTVELTNDEPREQEEAT